MPFFYKKKLVDKKNAGNLRELPALPQGRWFTCALGGGSNADGLTPGRAGSIFPGGPAAFSSTVLQIRGIRARKPETVESGSRDVRRRCAPALGTAQAQWILILTLLKPRFWSTCVRNS